MSTPPFWCCMCDEAVQRTDEPYTVYKPYVELTTGQVTGGPVFLCVECLGRIVKQPSAVPIWWAVRQPAPDEEHWP